jgi:lipase
VSLHLHTYGPVDGPPVLALHGVTGHGRRWQALADALPDIRLLAVDLRGHGHSPWTPPWTIDQHVADALGTLDALGLDRVPVMGHSFGGAIALHLARSAPERVERLVLLDPALGLDPATMLETAAETCAGESYPDRDSTPAIVTAWSEMARPAITPPPGLPTLLMPAAKEDYVDPAWVDRVRDEVGPQLTVHEVDSGHMVYLERTAEVAATIRAFLG